MSGKFLTTKQLAGRWKMAIGTLQNWRTYGIGPDFEKVEHMVLYSLQNVRRWETLQPEIVLRARRRGHLDTKT